MSKRTLIVIGVVLLVVGATLGTSCQSKAPAMSDGPGMLYFYSPV